MTGPHVLFQSHNRRGLGHLMRALNLAREVRALAPAAQVAVHTRNGSAPAFCPAEVTCLVDDGETAAWPDVLRRLAPDIVVYDTLLPAAPDAEPLSPSARVVYVMRKCRAERQEQIFASPFVGRVDAIVVPHTEEEFGYRLPPTLADRTLFAGLIARRPDPATHAALRQRYGIGRDDLLLVSTAGGGGFEHSASRVVETAAAVQRRLATMPAVRHVVVLGPHYTGPVPPLPGAHVVRTEPALVDLFALADLVVAEGGYNSVSELRLLGVPAVFLPGHRNYDDQEERVRALGRLGVAIVVADEPPAAVAGIVTSLLAVPARLAAMRAQHARHPVATGNRPAAAHLLGSAA